MAKAAHSNFQKQEKVLWQKKPEKKISSGTPKL
jgi:hypothetical protein